MRAHNTEGVLRLHLYNANTSQKVPPPLALGTVEQLATIAKIEESEEIKKSILYGVPTIEPKLSEKKFVVACLANERLVAFYAKKQMNVLNNVVRGFNIPIKWLCLDLTDFNPNSISRL